MPHRPRPRGVNFRGSGNVQILMKAHQKHFVKKDGELIHVQGKRRSFEEGELVEAPRHLSPSHKAWTLPQLHYDLTRELAATGTVKRADRVKRARLRAEMRMIKDQLSEARRNSRHSSK